MAIVVKDKKTGGALSIMQAMKDKGGDKSAVLVSTLKAEDDEYVECERTPTDIFSFDYATGGGFPKGKISIVWGQEGAGKTNLCFAAINQAQLDEPDKYQVFVDIENHFDPQWASYFISDMSRLILVKCENAEDAINKTEAYTMATDVNCIVIDSLAMLVAQNELESDAGKQAVGGSSALIGKMMRKLTARLSALAIEGCYPTVICTNQMRYKIGVMFGNPESMAGGMAPKHMSGLTVKLYGKDVVSEKDPVVYWREISMSVVKKKVPTLQKKAVWSLCIDTTPAGDKIGSIDDWNVVQTLMMDLGVMAKDGSKWVFAPTGEVFTAQYKIKEMLFANPPLLRKTKRDLIEREKKLRSTSGKG